MNKQEEVFNDIKETFQNIELIRCSNNKNITKRWLLEDKSFGRISEVYPFTNEALKTYNQRFNLESKKILTVTASGDQPIIAMLKGAKKIDTFDCNKLTYYHMFFKIAAIQALTYEDFISLYTIELKNYQNDPLKYYKKLRDAINKEDIKLYWDSFFKNSRSYFKEYFKLFFMGGCSIPVSKDVGYLDKETKKIIERNKNIDIHLDKYSNFTPLFRFSNENIEAYYKLYDFSNKNVLTVCGSSEQSLSALSLGAKRVDIFDINKLSYYYLTLKIAAIIALDKEEYLNFLDPTTNTKIQKKIYKIIRDALQNKHTQNFWDNIFKNDYFNYLFLNNNKRYVEDIFPYLEDQAYINLKSILPKANINFKNISIDKVPNEFSNKYDYINLSNIIDYIDNPDEIIKTYSQIFENMLKKNGICVLEYEWPLKQLCNFYIPSLFKYYNIKSHKLETDLMLLGKIYTYTKK